MDGSTDGWMDGWMDRWIDGWLDVLMERKIDGRPGLRIDRGVVGAVVASARAARIYYRANGGLQHIFLDSTKQARLAEQTSEPLGAHTGLVSQGDVSFLCRPAMRKHKHERTQIHN